MLKNICGIFLSEDGILKMLKTIIVDSDSIQLSAISEICGQSNKVNVIGQFTDPIEAINFSKNNVPDFAFLEYNLPKINGTILIKELRIINPDIVIIYITDNYGASEEILRVKPDFCIFKPYSEDDIFDGIKRAHLLSSLSNKKKIFVRAFGRFDVFVDKEIVYFPNKKSKELLALCIDRQGGEITMEMAIDILWPEKEYDEKAKRLYRKAVCALKKTLEQACDTNFFEHSRGSCRICVNKIKCDYYEYLKNPKGALVNPDGEYMFQYSWAEETAAKLYFNNLE